MEVVEMINILDNIEVLYHSCIKINKEKIIYIDPYHIDKNYNFNNNSNCKHLCILSQFVL